jgi:hypothetical protein
VPFVFDYAFKAQSIIMEKKLIEKAVYGETFNEEDQLTLGRRISLSVWGLFLKSYPGTEGKGALAYNAIFVEKDTSTPYIALFANINATTADSTTFLERLLLFIGGASQMVMGNPIGGISNQLAAFGLFQGENSYQVSYFALVSTAAGFFLLWSFIKMCIDVAYRAIKLYALRMIAPIAIISYIDPKSGKSGVFSKWLAECAKTYVSLFVRIFVFAIASVILNEIDITSAGDDFAQRIFFMLAVVAFLKSAPKFIDGILGTELSKDSESKFGADLLKQGLGGIGMAAVGGAVGLATAKKLGYNGGRGFWEGAKSGLTGGIEAVNKKDAIGVISGLAKAGNGANAMRKYYGLPTAAEHRKQKTEADLALKTAKDFVGVKDGTSKKVYDKMSNEEFGKYLSSPNAILTANEQNLKSKWENARNDTEREAIRKEFTSDRFKYGYSEKDSATGQIKKHSGYLDKDASGNYIRSDAEAVSKTVDELLSEKAKRFRASVGTIDAIKANFDNKSEIGKLWLEEEDNNQKKIVEENKAEFWNRRADDARDDVSAGGTGEIYVNQFGTRYALKRTLYNIREKEGSEETLTDPSGVTTTSKEYTISYKDASGTPVSEDYRASSKEKADAYAEAKAMQANEYEKVDRETLSQRASTANSQVGFYEGKIKEKAAARKDRMKNPQDGKEARDARIAQLIEAGKERAG